VLLLLSLSAQQLLSEYFKREKTNIKRQLNKVLEAEVKINKTRNGIFKKENKEIN
jgi:hypothetical protein